MTQDTRFMPRIARRMAGAQASEIRELLKLAEAPGVISFGGGIPDPALFPVQEMSQALTDVLADPVTGPQALQYSVSEGDPALRAWIAAYLTDSGAPCTADNILVTTGAQQALDFLGRLLIDRGDTVLTQWPTYLGALQAFAPNGPRYGDLGGANWMAQGAGADPTAFAYVVPDFANPTGATMDAVARERLLDLAHARDLPVIEDSPYAALRFEGQPERSLLARDIDRVGRIDASRVIQLGSFSKILSPGLRVGWVAASQEIIGRLVLMKQAADLNASRLTQMAVLRVAERGMTARIDRACQSYRQKRDAMMDALSRHMPEGVTWNRPDGGMFLWLTLPTWADAAAILPRAIEAGVAYVPGAAFYPDRSTANCLRLSYSLPSPEAIETGIARLGAVLAQEKP
ncbi:GntR family transcriptional regulator [Jannaschia pagri]|uniref:GntR family transcriptional regulator n=1 Tax=Jannaschia pagri TaxID=2829797 RepID=A0ABQ4NJA6_9RHOB|nr:MULTISPECIES: PLP-dependent aminotransferase family protein [unclassified Jannaschia]GIT90666.1 GntR family transcriptional regulator [Jannaschia sp. AI_61]GIT94498.1 GntR family transcriptional regulator [Jannaschia sp. AI_62]